MPIQDVIITTGSLVLIVALLPTVFSRTKPALSTSVLTGSTLAVFAGTYFSLDLRFAAITTAVSALLWFLIAVQSYRLR